MLLIRLKPESASTNYRLISLLSAAGKVGEAVLLRRPIEIDDTGKSYENFSLGFGKGTQRPSNSSAELNGSLAPITLRRQQALSTLMLKDI
jgi:hypothetical protein